VSALNAVGVSTNIIYLAFSTETGAFCGILTLQMMHGVKLSG
jgi:hypothetical protein